MTIGLYDYLPPEEPRYFVARAPRDRLDWIAQEVYGYTAGAVERLYDANPGLADGPVWLKAGTVLVLPVLPPPEPKRVRLWT